MNTWCYILFSRKLNRFYVGSTELLPKQRLQMHLSNTYGSSKFTAKADDWELFMEVECNSIICARKVETHLKKMRNSKYYLWLSQNPNAVEKIKERFT
jgi:putative endonuclease